MGNEWRMTTLGAIATKDGYGLVDGPFGSNLPASSYTSEGVPVIRGSNLTLGLGRFNTDCFVYVSEETATRLRRSLCKPEDIVFTKKGTLGQTGLIPKRGPFRAYLLSSNQMKLTVDKSVADPRFVYYYVSSKKSVKKIIQDSEQTGVPKTNITYLKTFPIRLPSLAEQCRIADLLGVIDDKIELNRQTNQTLESMAQALFKSWFVDFDPVIDNALAAGNEIPEPLAAKAAARHALQEQGTDKANQPHTLPDHIRQLFPSRFQFTEELGWIPEGWDVKRADEISNVSIGRTPPRKEAQWFSDHQTGNIPWLSIRDLGSHSIFYADSSEYLTHEAVEQFNVKTIPAGTVVLSFKLTLGRIGIAAHTLTTNEAIAHFCESTLPKEFLYSYLKVFDFSSLGSTSSIATAVNSKIIKAMPFLVPPQRAIESFSSIVRSMFNKAYELERQTRSLMETRDTLLPKLLSGELRIPETKKELDEALA